MLLREGDPGDCFLTIDECHPDRWAVWKILDGVNLQLARKLGYSSRLVVSMVLYGDKYNLPDTPKLDELDPPYAMNDPETCSYLRDVSMKYLGRL